MLGSTELLLRFANSCWQSDGVKPTLRSGLECAAAKPFAAAATALLATL